MAEKKDFKGRSIARSSDLSRDEKFYLFEKTRKLKEAFYENNSDVLDEFKVKGALNIYLCFFEPSTRTKESFKNAAKFMNARVNNLDVDISSLTKSESYWNTIKTLEGYDNSIFIIRSKVEGLCTWLGEASEKFSKRFGGSKSAFINGGDGKHEHPTQEELDQFSFFEQLNWDNSRIHIALVGDLFHGRTVHSKVSGLKIFEKVKVDLIAPEILQMPEYYVNEMKNNGFEVRVFDSLNEYYNQDDVANIQYFTRLQIERMGESVIQREDELREAVTFDEKYIDKIPSDTKLYHPQPFYKEKPTIPSSMSFTKFNGYDNQSINGFFYRIVLLNAISGNIGSDFKGSSPENVSYEYDYIEKVEVKQKGKPEPKVGIRPISDGVVVDHICKGETAEEIWNHLHLVLKVTDISDIGFCGVCESGEGNKGIFVLPRQQEFDEELIKRFTAICPGSTLNFIKNDRVEKKLRLHMPPRITGFEEISCKNLNCISREEYSEGVEPEFHMYNGKKYICKYCDTTHSFKEIWNVK